MSACENLYMNLASIKDLQEFGYSSSNSVTFRL